MAAHKPPHYHIEQGELPPYKLTIPGMRTRNRDRKSSSPPSTLSKESSREKLISKSMNLKANNLQYGKGHLRREGNYKHFDSGSESGSPKSSRTTSTPVSLARTEPAFVLPPFIELPPLPPSPSSQSPITTKKSLFMHPTAIYSDDLDDSEQYPPGNESTETSFCEPPEIDTSVLKRSRLCPFCQKRYPPSFGESPPTASRAKYGFCQRHENAEILEQGKARGYPSSIDNKVLGTRVRKLLPQLRRVITSSTESEFLTLQRKKTTRKNAAAPMIQMKMFEDSQPGYYGPQGAELISQIVMEKFGEKIRKSDNLLPALKFCGGVTGYVSTVLVPEVGVRLIMEDLGIEREEARGVMKESVEYGAVANAAVEISDDDDGSSDMGSDSD